MNSREQENPIRVAVLSFLFNWPSTGGGIVHTVELADFLGRAGYTVRHIYARYPEWGIGQVTECVPFDSLPLDFDEATFGAAMIEDRFRDAIREFDPDYVIITDSWNSKPLLAEAVREFPYILRLQASECLCPLNNLRFLPTGEQCGNHQLADAGRCRTCVQSWSRNSGGLHQAERELVGFGTPRYADMLRRAFAEAEAVLVVNELAAAMVGPYARKVKVVTSGFDAARFAWDEHEPSPEKPHGAKLQILMAGLAEDPIKGFHVLDAACRQLWQRRGEFELLVTRDPCGQTSAYSRNIGWLSQDALPACMRAADIVVVPTVAQDALGRTAVEAMAAARPVVASRIGGLPYTIGEGAGLLFEPGDAGDLAHKLELLLDDWRLRRTLGALGRRRFEEHFTWQAIIDKHYRPLLANRRPRSAVSRASNAAPPSTKRTAAPMIDPYSSGRSDATPEPSIRRVALIYDDEKRPETTGVYCRRALKDLVEVAFFRPGQMDSIPRDDFDLYLNIDDGLRYQLSDDLRPSAWWCIDSHIDFDWSLEKSRTFDFVFAAQRDGAERLKRNGIESAVWLPLACDPEIHGGQAEDGLARPSRHKEFDVCFVGNLLPGPRADLVRLIQQYFKNVYVGQAYFEEMSRIYSTSRILFNRSVKNDVNMRVFEALASGSLLLTNDLAENGQADLFRDGVHLATYRDAHELLDKLRFYLRREDVRERIAAAGRAEVLAKHTYRHRMRQLLAEAEATVARDRAYRSPHAPHEVNRAVEAVSHAPPDRERNAHAIQNPQAKIQNPPHAPSYFNFARPELLALVPETAARILDIGCGAGRLGAALKARQACHVAGIELDQHAVELAQGSIDRAICGDVENTEFQFEPHSFDCIICGDVLEHLRSPEGILHRIRQWLAPDGCLVASIPNVAHRSVIANLLQGDFEYEPAGLLDTTHLRFFTRRSIEKLFYRTHFDLETIGIVGGDGYDAWIDAGRPGEVAIGPVRAQGLTREQAEELHAYQYLLVAHPAVVADRGLTSIVMVTHNAWQYTARCLESIRFRTDEPYELIVVDNGSTDGTPERLREMSDIKLIANSDNRGFPAAVNQGIAVSGGRQVLLLNNDVVVTTGWLRRMLAALSPREAAHLLLPLGEGRGEGGLNQAVSDTLPRPSNPKSEIENPKREVGLVGPLTNCASGYQEIAVDYSSLDALDSFAWEHGKQHAGQTAEVERLIGFCLLIRREVIEQVGLFDERFGIGNFEDDDFCRRAREAGWRLVVARDAFIHHFGHRSFEAAHIDLGALLDRNQSLYSEKWSEAIGASTRPHPGPGHPLAGPEGEGDRRASSPIPHPSSLISLSLCMIARDNERTIRAALESIRPWVDEMIVVDTGSTDATPEICRELGARVYHLPWPDSFSVARNESLKQARGEWIFWMDSDDVIDADNGRKLRQLVADLANAPPGASRKQKDGLGRPSSVFGYVMQVHCPGPGEDGRHNVTVVDHVKLFRNLPELRFEGRIHEQVLPSIRRLDGEAQFTDIFVVHAGADHSPATRRAKLKRDFRLLKLELRDQPEHPFTLFNLGMTYADAGRHRQAICFLRRSLAKSDPAQSQVRKAYALLAASYLQTGKPRKALRTCRKGLRFFRDDPELRFRLGLAAHALRRLDQAERAYLAVLNNRCERHFSSIDRGIVGFKARQNLAVVYTDRGDLKQAEDQWRAIIAEMPDYRDAWLGLVENLSQQRQPTAMEACAAQLSERAVTSGSQSMLSACSIVAARLNELRGDLAAATEAAREAVARQPNDLVARDLLCRLLIHRGQAGAAAAELSRLVALDGANAAAHHNLGVARLETGDFSGAARALADSLKIRPRSPATRQALAYARQMLEAAP